jgi:hypothetical protein
MRSQFNQEAASTIALRLWTYTEAAKAVPYLRAVVRSLRENRLEMQRAKLRVQRIDVRPGRPDRQTLILRAEAVRDVESAEDRFNEAVLELMTIGAYCIDPKQGLALIPFSHDGELAWFVFDLFVLHGLSGWRFQADPLETRRPLLTQPTAARTPSKEPEAIERSEPWPSLEQASEFSRN